MIRLFIIAPETSLMMSSVKSNRTRVMTSFFYDLVVVECSPVSDHGSVAETSLSGRNPPEATVVGLNHKRFPNNGVDRMSR